MSQHTPAPWVIAHGRCIYGSGDLVKPFVASVEDDHNDSETAANARLIAAAPDLLAVLRDVREAWLAGRIEDVEGILTGDVCRDVIAKATGEAL
jgi:hypothetical protein